jgi:hypothetical protein
MENEFEALESGKRHFLQHFGIILMSSARLFRFSTESTVATSDFEVGGAVF